MDEKDWTKPNESGDIDVPDDLVPLFNSVGAQIRFHTISGKNEVLTVAHIVQRAQKFFAKKPIDMVLFCPKCNEQHIDEPEPENCKNCGHDRKKHFQVGQGTVCGEPFGPKITCPCKNFEPWLNAPHKKHRCKNPACNHVWKPANIPTNGVAEIENQQNAP